ncbi:MAG: DegT/DnrJ/EryC1/StrS family aminotransferase [Candidatus Omnitrophica bacterium]|nr:DegT/DnrJ/EryC1/StrS family aminotransferase [Candidatus Omnitrophota bacterium]
MISHSKPTISQKEINAVSAVLKSGLLAQGRLVTRFEQDLRKFIKTSFAVATNSGSSALHLALLGLKIRPQDEVIIPSYVCAGVLNAVNYVCAKARLVDINPDDFNISADSVRKNISLKTKAIIVPHMFGLAADLDGLKKFKIPLIEDCALSIGATYKGRQVGSFGDAAVFSFYATKMLTTAEGGGLATNRSDIYSFARDKRDYDNKDSYQLRFNYKMNEIQAAMGIEQLKRINQFISHRQKIASMYNNSLSGLGIGLPEAPAHRVHVYFRYCIKSKNCAESIIKKLRGLGIEAKRPVFKPLHNYLGLSNKDYPVTTQVYKSVVSLPIYPQLKEEQVRFVIDKVRRILK